MVFRKKYFQNNKTGVKEMPAGGWWIIASILTYIYSQLPLEQFFK